MFTFTDSWTFTPRDSSLVAGLFYSAPKKQLLVRLHGDKQYIYGNVTQDEAKQIAQADSKGRAYNDFRKFRRGGNAGSAAHGEVVVADVPTPSRTVASGGSWTGTTGVGSLTVTPGLVAKSERAYVVSYVLNGVRHNSTVTASNDVAAEEDVLSKLKSLGFDASVKGVARA